MDFIGFFQKRFLIFLRIHLLLLFMRQKVIIYQDQQFNIHQSHESKLSCFCRRDARDRNAREAR